MVAIAAWTSMEASRLYSVALTYLPVTVVVGYVNGVRDECDSEIH